VNSVKLNKKHLFSFLLTLVLLIAFNVNVFAGSSYSADLYNCNHYCTYTKADSSLVDVSSQVTKTRLKANIDSSQHDYVKFSFPSIFSVFPKSVTLNPDLNLYTKTDYKYSYYVRFGDTADCECTVIAFITFSNGSESQTISISTNDLLTSNTWVKCEGSFTTPDMSGNVNAKLTFVLGQNNDGSVVGNNFYCTFIDFFVDDPLLNGTPITPADTSGLTAIMGDYDNTIDKLPSIKDYDTDSLFDANFDSYTSAMNFIKQLFENFIDFSGMGAVLTFALAIGLATYVIGRKVG